MIEVGQKAPSFKLLDKDKNEVTDGVDCIVVLV